MPSKYKLMGEPLSQPSYLDSLRSSLDEPKLDQGPIKASLKGFLSGAIEGAQGLGHGLVEAVKHPMTAAPSLVRAGSGLMSGEGGPLGATISGGGELTAEALEGSLFNQSPLRSLLKVGTAAGIGAIPMAATIKAGRPVASMARSAAYSGGGELAREISSGETPDPSRIGVSTAIGGATGGVLGKLLGVGQPATRGSFRAGDEFSSAFPSKEAYQASKTPATPTSYEIQPTSQTGEGTGTLYGGKVDKGKLRGAEYKPDIPPKPIQASGEDIRPTGPLFGREKRVPYGGGGGQTADDIAGRSADAVASAKAEGQADALLRKEAEADAVAAAKQRAIDGGAEPQFSYGESVAAPLPEGGTGRVSTRFVKPAEEEADAADILESPLEKLFKSIKQPAEVKQAPAPVTDPTTEPLKPKAVRQPKAKLSAVEKFNKGVDDTVSYADSIPATQSTPPNTEPTISAPNITEAPPLSGPLPFTESPATFYKSPVDATGQNYRAAKADPSGNSLGTRQAGVSLNSEASKAGLPTKGPTDLGKFLTSRVAPELSGGAAPAAPAMVNQSGTGSKRGANFLDNLKASAEAQQPAAAQLSAGEDEGWIARELADVERRRSGLPTDEQGVAGLRPLFGLGGAAIGAPVGAAMTDDEHHKEGAVAGGLAGFGLGAAAPSLANVNVREVVKNLPRFQRFSLLSANPNSALANIFAGPWGSGTVMGLEKTLSGDSRGPDLLKRMLNIPQFGRDFFNQLGDASQRIGRAEGDVVSNPNFGQKAMAVPGTLMTAGDMATNRAIQGAGFTEEQAKRGTLTSEPELFAFKKVADMFKGTPSNPNDMTKAMADMAFPFKRTPANIGEQGAFRFPGLGFIFQSMRNQPDPIREQIVQQLLNAGIGVGSYSLGSSLDPESAKTVRKYVTNMAGPHSLMAGAGFAAGQAAHAGQPALSGKTYQEFADALPLPTHQALQDWLKSAGDLIQGNPSIPRGMKPFRDWELPIPGATSQTEPQFKSKYRLQP